MLRRHFLLALGILPATLGGCKVPGHSAGTITLPQDQTRANSYSLLYQLLEQQRHVDKLLLVKMESGELKLLIKAIAAASATGAKRLEEFARHDATIRLDQTSLPPGETATRNAIANTKKKELLTPFNSSFELDLLLTQSEALSYAWHLAKVAAASEPNYRHARSLNDLSTEMKNLHGQVLLLMRSHLISGK
jgi:hypothetical protein